MTRWLLSRFGANVRPSRPRALRSASRRAVAAAVFLAWLAAVAGLEGCSYRPVDPREIFGEGVDVIRLQMMENRTPEIGFEAMIQDSLQEEFTRRGLLRVVYGDDRGAADLVLGGSILLARVQPTAFSSVALSLEDEIRVRLDVAVQNLADGELVLVRPGLFFSERFLASADPQVYESNKEQALRNVAARAASQIHDELFQKF